MAHNYIDFTDIVELKQNIKATFNPSYGTIIEFNDGDFIIFSINEDCYNIKVQTTKMSHFNGFIFSLELIEKQEINNVFITTLYINQKPCYRWKISDNGYYDKRIYWYFETKE